MTKKNPLEKEEKDPLSLFIKKSTNWVQKYFIPLGGLLGAGLLTFGLTLFYSHLQDQQNKKAVELLYQARKVLVLAEQKEGGTVLSEKGGGTQDFFKSLKPTEYSSEIEKSVNQYWEVIQKWASKPVALSAAIELAYFLNQYKKPEKAVELLKKSSFYKTKNLHGFFLALQLGTYLIDIKEYEQALKEFSFITQNSKAKWLWPFAFVKQALCLEKQGKVDQAQKIYEKIKNNFPDSSVHGDAVKYSNFLKLQSKLSSLSSEANKAKESKTQKRKL